MNNTLSNPWLEDIKERNIHRMTNLAEKKLNPKHYYLSEAAKKRLHWLYVLYYEQGGNVMKAANKIGISRQWLSPLKNLFEKKGRDPRKLEPESKAPHSTKNRKRISKDVEDEILKIRNDSRNVWGKVKIAVALERDHQIKIDPNTVNKYLHKHKKIDPKISLKNTRAWQAKVARESPEAELVVRYRPPKAIKDLAPGALVEKDMKYVGKHTRTDFSKDASGFFSQHTEIDSFTRIRSTVLKRDASAKGSAEAHEESKKKFDFVTACMNTDNGSENKKEFRDALKKDTVFQFYSNKGTPTDNPRVERSHLTDDVEFYLKGGLKDTFEEQVVANSEWDRFYNWTRPHQALGYLTPIAFHELWKVDEKKAHSIVETYQKYLKKQSMRLASARRIKKKEQVEKLMEFIDVKINEKVGIKKAINSLIHCQLCSVA
jgi:transposase InsO family protein